MQLELPGSYKAHYHSLDALAASTTQKGPKVFKDVCVHFRRLLFMRVWEQHLDETWGGTKLGFMRWFRPRGGRFCNQCIQVESQSQCAVCPSPAARQGLFPLSLYCFEPQRWAWLHKSGGNATRPLLRLPVPAAKCPPFCFCADSSQGACSLCWCCSASLPMFVGRMIRTTPSSRLKALASPCQRAERLQ